MSSTQSRPEDDRHEGRSPRAGAGAGIGAGAGAGVGVGAGRTEPEADPAGDRWQNQLSGLGGFIRMQRRLADMSLREMANLTSVSNAYLSQVERGLHQPSLRVLRSIAQALKIAPEDLLRRANFMGPKDSAVSTSEPAAEPAPEPAPADTEAAILADPRLTPAQRDALLNVYRSFRDPA